MQARDPENVSNCLHGSSQSMYLTLDLVGIVDGLPFMAYLAYIRPAISDAYSKQHAKIFSLITPCKN